MEFPKECSSFNETVEIFDTEFGVVGTLVEVTLGSGVVLSVQR